MLVACIKSFPKVFIKDRCTLIQWSCRLNPSFKHQSASVKRSLLLFWYIATDTGAGPIQWLYWWNWLNDSLPCELTAGFSLSDNPCTAQGPRSNFSPVSLFTCHQGATLAGKLIKGQTGFPRGAALTSWKPAHRSSAYSVFDAVTLKSLHLCPLSCVSHTRLLHHFWLQLSLSSFVCVYSGFNLFSQLNALRCWAQSSHQTLQISLCLVPRAGRLWESSDVSSPSV